MNRTTIVVAAGAVGAAGLLARRRRASAVSATAAAAALPAASFAAAFLPPVGRHRTVPTVDGVHLAVTEYGPPTATLTVLFAHGYGQSSALWGRQVRDLTDARPDLRVVTYDHRGHGASGRVTPGAATLEQLAHDLETMLSAVVPTGDVVLAGHSMGGMTIMALAEVAPHLFGTRIVGVAFVATSSGDLDAVSWGLPAPVARVAKRLLPVLHAKGVRDELNGKARKVNSAEAKLIFPKGADQALVRETLDVQRGTRADTVAWFLPTFSTHDRLAALKVVENLPSLVIVGDRDRVCPLPHSRALAGALQASELVIYPGVGHMVQLERSAEVSAHVLRLVDRCVPASLST